MTPDGGVRNAVQGMDNSHWEVGVAQGSVKHAAEGSVAWVKARQGFSYSLGYPQSVVACGIEGQEGKQLDYYI